MSTLKANDVDSLPTVIIPKTSQTNPNHPQTQNAHTTWWSKLASADCRQRDAPVKNLAGGHSSSDFHFGWLATMSDLETAALKQDIAYNLQFDGSLQCDSDVLKRFQKNAEPC